MNNFIKPFALVMALTIPAIASADITANNVTVGEVRITYTTADAASSYGRTALEGQIRVVAETASSEMYSLRPSRVRQLMENRSCYDKAVADAMKSISTNA